MTKKNDDDETPRPPFWNEEYRFLQLLGPTKNYPQHWVELGAVGRKLYLDAVGYHHPLDSDEKDPQLKDTIKKKRKKTI
tara:strand:+ start:1340 stop:1576 length:237 start_codon:yes stop_codon:yes gene_type:complete